MGKQGKHLDRFVRRLIYKQYGLGKTAEQIYEDVIADDWEQSVCSLDRIKKLVTMFNDPSRGEETTDYLCAKGTPEEERGRPRKMNDAELEMLSTLIKEQSTRRLRKLTATYSQLFGKVSLCTIYRRMTEDVEDGGLGLSRKKQTRIHDRCNPIEGLAYYDHIAHQNPLYCINIDGCVEAAKDFRDDYAWSEKGRPAVCQQLRIHDKSYAVMAAVTPIGVLTYQRYQADFKVTGYAVEEFLRNRVRPLVSPENWLVCDNASNQSTFGVHQALDDIFGADMWYHIPAYSPRFAPIERVFALIKNYIREREEQGEIDPEALIDEAFAYYSVNGEGASSIMGFFDGYFSNHQQWVEEQIANYVV